QNLLRDGARLLHGGLRFGAAGTATVGDRAPGPAPLVAPVHLRGELAVSPLRRVRALRHAGPAPGRPPLGARRSEPPAPYQPWEARRLPWGVRPARRGGGPLLLEHRDLAGDRCASQPVRLAQRMADGGLRRGQPPLGRAHVSLLALCDALVCLSDGWLGRDSGPGRPRRLTIGAALPAPGLQRDRGHALRSGFLRPEPADL